MTWDLVRRGWWKMLAAALGALLLPFLLLSALELEGGFDRDDPSLLIMNIVLAQMSMLMFAAAVMTSQGQLTRFYALPITTSTLVTWLFVPAMALIAVASAASTAILNLVFDLNWPIWGPALFAAAALVAVEAVLWLTESTGWVIVGLTLVAAALGLWFKARYGALFSMPVHQWLEVTPWHVATLAAIVVAAWCVGVFAVGRNRRGDRLPALGLWAWLLRVLDSGVPIDRRFRTPAAAQIWFEWRAKGWAMPAVVVFGIVLGVTGWSIFSQNGAELLEGFAFGGGLLSGAAIVVGLIIGNTGRDDKSYEIGQFLATRPVTNTEFARTILLTSAQSVFAGWLIWALSFGAVYLCLVPTGLIATPPALRELPWWYYPATLLGPWAIVAVGASIGLTGRSLLWPLLLCGVPGGWCGMSLLVRAVFSPESQAVFLQASWTVFTVGCLLGTAWAFAAAKRRALIGLPTLSAGLCAWLALAAVVALGSTRQPASPALVSVWLIGISALVVAPLASAPLALAWNRTR
jgi:hypothetical protein